MDKRLKPVIRGNGDRVEFYPRPQLVRDSFLSLDGKWDFFASEEPCDVSFSEKINVPYPPESALSGIGRRMGKSTLYYRRSFTLPRGFRKDRVIIHFGAVDCICDLYINGKAAYHNEGGYIPFSADITEYLEPDSNEILLRVKDGTSKDFPYGKQRERRGGMWYTPVSGIWQTVWLESLPEKPILGLKITQDTRSATIRIDTEAKDVFFSFDGDEWEPVTDGQITVSPENPVCWTPENPKLYEFFIKTPTDFIGSYFALRTVGVSEFGGKMRLTLNGEPYFFNGLLDQGYFYDGIFTPKSPIEYEKDIKTAKALGFNMLRKHIKIEPLIFYYLCDKEGMAVFQDMVNSGSYSFIFDTALPTVGFKSAFSDFRNRNKRARESFLKTAELTQKLLYNHPSVCLYTIFNEGWGQFSADRVYVRLKENDSTRLYDSTSGWFKGTKSDVDSRHIYFKRVKIKHPDGRPYFLSEFGGYALPLEGHTYGDGKYGYAFMKNKDELFDALRKLYIEDLKPLIKDGLSALVYTQLSDVEDETNGFITYDREIVKVDAAKMADINRELYEEFKFCTKNL